MAPYCVTSSTSIPRRYIIGLDMMGCHDSLIPKDCLIVVKVFHASSRSGNWRGLLQATRFTLILVLGCPGLETEIISEKQPFGYRSKLLVPGTIMALFLTTLDHYVSDSRFSLPSATSPLLERVDRLITCFQMLQLRQNSKHSQLLLISYDWFEEAARIKRRILAQGGGDHCFFFDLVGNNQETEGPIRGLFLLDNDGFNFTVPGSRHSSNDAESFCIRQCAEKTLSDYEKEPYGSWKHSLFEMRDYVTKVLSIPRDVIIRPSINVQLVEFTGSCDLWDSKVLLGAPVT